MMFTEQIVRFWVTKNSELSVHEQLVRQVILAILSEDLPAGHKLPSTRSVARRYRIHSNTVSAAFHHLVEQGWLELRRGNGLFVRPKRVPVGDGSQLDLLLADLLRNARALGHEPEELLRRLERLVHPARCQRVIAIHPDPAMQEILQAEIIEHVGIAVEAGDIGAISSLSRSDECLVAALPMQAEAVRKLLVPGTPYLALLLRSVRGSLEGQMRPEPNAILTIVSKSPQFRQWAKAVLIAVGIEPDCLSEVDTALESWQERAGAGTLAITDVVAARHLPFGCQFKAFRVIADASIAEMKQICHVAVTPQ
jgi:DNA-binding transcriptional regulator YhcF (GntR family)